MNRRHFGLKLAGAITALALTFSTASAADKVTVFAAASLKNALDAISAQWKADTSKETAISYAASSALAKQVESGAPADVFISADLDWMKYLTDKNLVTPGTEIKLLGNQIVLVAPKDSTAEAKIDKGFDLAKLLNGGKLAMGDVKAVPAGKYGKAALEYLGVWGSVEKDVAMAENVRAALKLVATGEAALGIVYTTDAHAEKGVKIIGTFPEDSHPPIVYPVAVIAASKNPDAAEFVKYLQGAKAQALFKDQGFTILVPAASN
ncbi:molybdate ABC transporter substrate-binding protein [Aestuariivirga sp.]|uniref:molybdate ABC transporter substrate-binding protein n=1 Tax=Aestuariivirga sp. TaxID=2650926 RepID=UPI0039E574A2